MGFFTTNTMTLCHEDGQIVQQHLTVQLDPANLDWQMQVSGMIATDIYDCETIGWATPVPVRSDYFLDEVTQTRYSMYSTVFTGVNSLQFRVSKVSGRTP
jgi:hypothetical protein